MIRAAMLGTLASLSRVLRTDPVEATGTGGGA